MIVKLFSKVPTVYQQNSIKSFGLPVQGLIDGSFYCEKEFQTKKEAINYMLKRADILFDDPKDLKKSKSVIRKKNILEYDAAILSIEKVN